MDEESMVWGTIYPSEYDPEKLTHTSERCENMSLELIIGRQEVPIVSEDKLSLQEYIH